jgi:putative nucleotidyltransferase with HDIG domain
MSGLLSIAHRFKRVKLRYLLFGFLVLYGSLPLVVISTASLVQNRERFESQEVDSLTNQAEALSRELSDYVLSVRKELRQLGVALRTVTANDQIEASLRNALVTKVLRNFTGENQGLPSWVRFVREGREFGPRPLSEEVQTVRSAAYRGVREAGEPAYHYVPWPATNEPAALLTVPVLEERSGELLYIVQGLVRLPVDREVGGDVALFDHAGEVLWSLNEAPTVLAALRSSALVQDFVRWPATVTGVRELPLEIGGRTQTMIGQLSGVADTGWGVLVYQPRSAAFEAVARMRNSTLLSAVLMVLLALFFAVVATRLISNPIQHLAETSHEIAGGKFGTHVEARGLGFEIANLAENFNLMSDHVREYVQRLEHAAKMNRELFIGSIRAFLAAIEAKEPYTRGHSERVASYSQTIARHLSMPREFLERIWVAGLLHDIGKIGIDDRILQKGDVFTDEEYEKMKLHAVIGAEIMSSIEQLKEMLPAIRWHHEKWNGEGYPDGLKGEQIPLIARIVAVADTFDAVTTQRVYQDPYTPDEAVEIVRRLIEKSFDPRVAEAFLAAFAAGDVRLKRQKPAPRPPQPVKLKAAVHT